MARARFLIITWDGGGNVPPALALAERLVERGHRVRVVAPPALAAGVAATGAEVVPYGSVAALPHDASHEANWPVVDAILNGRGMVENLNDAIRSEPIDALVVDSMSGAGLAVGEHHAIPTAVLVHTLYQPYRTWGPQFVNIRETREAVGLAAVEPDRFADGVLGRAAVVLALVPPGFDVPVTALPRNTRYVGPILDHATTAKATRGGVFRSRSSSGRAKVLITFGSTLQRQRDALRPVLSAMAELPVDGLLTLGEVVDPKSVSASANVGVLGHIAHNLLLPDVDAVVCHGGLSTIMASLAFGKPLVVIPQGRDQGTNAERVVAAGAGLALAQDATPATIATAIAHAVDDPDLRAAAQRWSAAIARLGHGSVATDLVERIVSARSGAAVGAGRSN